MIRLFYIGQTPVVCSPFILIPVLFAMLAEKPGLLLLNVLALFLHELAHTFAAKAMGYRIRQVELQPLGFVARLYRRIANRRDELAVAAAGPVFSLLTGTMAYLGANLFHGESSRFFVCRFGEMNLFLGLFNLIPVIPLDGGRMAEALFSSRYSKKRCKRILMCAAIIFSAAFVTIGTLLLYVKRARSGLYLICIGVFLGLSVLRERKWDRGNAADQMLRRFELINSGNPIPVQLIAVHENTSCAEALVMMDYGSYNAVFVLDDELTLKGILSEGELTAGIVDKGQDAALSILIKPH